MPFQNVHLILRYTFQFILSMLASLSSLWCINHNCFKVLFCYIHNLDYRSASIVHFSPFNYWSHFPALHISYNFFLYATLFSLFIWKNAQTTLDAIFFHGGLFLPGRQLGWGVSRWLPQSSKKLSWFQEWVLSLKSSHHVFKCLKGNKTCYMFVVGHLLPWGGTVSEVLLKPRFHSIFLVQAQLSWNSIT